MTSPLYSSGQAKDIHGAQRSPISLAYNEQWSVLFHVTCPAWGLQDPAPPRGAGGEAAVEHDSYPGGGKENLTSLTAIRYPAQK